MKGIFADGSPDEKCLAKFGDKVASTANLGTSAVAPLDGVTHAAEKRTAGRKRR
jgi:hypothetical protein